MAREEDAVERPQHLFKTVQFNDSIEDTLSSQRPVDRNLSSPENKDSNLRPILQDDALGGNLWMKYMRNGDQRYMAGMYLQTIQGERLSPFTQTMQHLGLTYLFTLVACFAGSTTFGAARFVTDLITHEKGDKRPHWRRYANLAMNEMGATGPHLATKMALAGFLFSVFSTIRRDYMGKVEPQPHHIVDVRQIAHNPFFAYGLPVLAFGYYNVRKLKPYARVSMIAAALFGSIHLGYKAVNYKQLFGVLLENDPTLKREPWKRYDHTGHTVDPGYQVVAVNDDGTLDPENKNGNLKKYPHPFPYTPENMDVVAELGALRPRYIPCNYDWSINVRDEGEAMNTWIAGVEKDQNHLHNGLFGVKNVVFHDFVPAEQAAAWKEDPELRQYPFLTFRRPTGEEGVAYERERAQKMRRVEKLRRYRDFAYKLHNEAPGLDVPDTTPPVETVFPRPPIGESILALDSDSAELSPEQQALYNSQVRQELRSRMMGKSLMRMSYLRLLNTLNRVRKDLDQ